MRGTGDTEHQKGVFDVTKMLTLAGHRFRQHLLEARALARRDGPRKHQLHSWRRRFERMPAQQRQVLRASLAPSKARRERRSRAGTHTRGLPSSGSALKRIVVDAE